MSRSVSLEKLAKATRLNAEAQKLFAEAIEELAREDPTPAPAAPDTPITEEERARMRKRFRAMGHGS